MNDEQQSNVTDDVVQAARLAQRAVALLEKHATRGDVPAATLHQLQASATQMVAAFSQIVTAATGAPQPSAARLYESPDDPAYIEARDRAAAEAIVAAHAARTGER